MKKLFILALTAMLAFSARAQSLAENGTLTVAPERIHGEGDWIFHHDRENGILYIDFSRLGSQAMYLDVRNRADAELIRRENLDGMPSDVIFELDMQPFGQGAFVVEVVTYQTVARQEVEVSGKP
jgi:hypothetical protein